MHLVRLNCMQNRSSEGQILVHPGVSLIQQDDYRNWTMLDDVWLFLKLIIQRFHLIKIIGPGIEIQHVGQIHVWPVWTGLHLLNKNCFNCVDLLLIISLYFFFKYIYFVDYVYLCVDVEQLQIIFLVVMLEFVSTETVSRLKNAIITRHTDRIMIKPVENWGERFGEFESRSVKTWDAAKGFHLLQNSNKLCWGFH